MDHSYNQPELHKDLIFLPGGNCPDEVSEARRNLNKIPFEAVELCRACGWNSSHERHAGYDPRVKIYHARNNIGLWQIGQRWMIRDQPKDGTMGNDYMTQEFIRNHPDLKTKIPLVKEMRLLSEPDDQIQFTLMSRAQGERLDLLWKTLNQDQKTNYAFQLADIVKALRQVQAPVAQKVNGDCLDDMVVAQCFGVHPPTCKKIGATDDDWFDNMAPELRHGLAEIHCTRDPDVIEAKLRELRDNFPSSEPYVLTHGDLNLSNVIVKDDKIEAIIDWEMAGFHPWWMERVRMGSQWPYTVDDVDGKDTDGDIFDAAWDSIQPELDRKIWEEDLYERIDAVISVWRACTRDHPNLRTCWLRPAFCDCKPHAGSIHWLDAGRRPGHQIRDFDPALMPRTVAKTSEDPDPRSDSVE